MLNRLILAALLLFALAEAAAAAQTIHLPDRLCLGADGIFADGYEPVVFTSDPSLGSGGVYPGSHSRSFMFGALGQQTYYLYVPAQYHPGRAMPLMVVLEGYTGSHSDSMQVAQDMRDDWIAPANAYGFIVVVPVNNKSNGSWLPADGSAQLNDYDAIGAVMNDLGQAYNIEHNRTSVWGFSAGGHIAWDMLLNNGQFARSTPLNSGNLASMATSAANSEFACFQSTTYCAARFSSLPRKVPVDIHIGNSDPNYFWAADDEQRLLANGWTTGDTSSFNLFVGGHTYKPAHLQQIAKFACGFAVQP